jgi:monoamine oxidase
VEQTVRSEFGVEPSESSAIQLLFILPVVNGKEVELLSYSDERFIIDGGSSALTDAMAAALGSSVKLGKVLKSVDTEGNAYSLTFRDGQKVTADIVIVTVPNTVLRDITLNVAVPAKFRDYVAQVGLGFNEKVVASFSNPFWRTNRRFALDLDQQVCQGNR